MVVNSIELFYTDLSVHGHPVVHGVLSFQVMKYPIWLHVQTLMYMYIHLKVIYEHGMLVVSNDPFLHPAVILSLL